MLVAGFDIQVIGIDGPSGNSGSIRPVTTNRSDEGQRGRTTSVSDVLTHVSRPATWIRRYLQLGNLVSARGLLLIKRARMKRSVPSS